MKVFSFAVTIAVTVTGCGIADFDVDQAIQEQRIVGSGVPAPIAGLFPIPLSLDLDAKIKAQDTGPIDSVTLSSLTLAITATDRGAGDTDDWAFLDSVEVFVQSRREGSTLPRVRIAHATTPGPVTELVFEVDGGVNLEPYVREGSVVESAAAGTQPVDDVSFAGGAVFTVHPL